MHCNSSSMSAHMQLSVFIHIATVAYVKYYQASAAAAAQEHLHNVVLSSGCTKLKIMFAEGPHSRYRIPCLSTDSFNCCSWHVHAGYVKDGCKGGAGDIFHASSCGFDVRTSPCVIWLIAGARQVTALAQMLNCPQILIIIRHAHGSSSLYPETPMQALYRFQLERMPQHIAKHCCAPDAGVMWERDCILPVASASTLLVNSREVCAGGNGALARVAILQDPSACDQGSRFLQVLAVLLGAACPGVHRQQRHGVLRVFCRCTLAVGVHEPHMLCRTRGLDSQTLFSVQPAARRVQSHVPASRAQRPARACG
jgi:hypothetical protein